MKSGVFACALVLAVATAPVHAAEYELSRAFPGVTFEVATDIQCPRDGSYRLFVVEKGGLIKVFAPWATATPGDVSTFLDLTTIVRARNEAGLLGLAFHPSFASNGYFYVFYVSNFPYQSTVARYTVSEEDPNVADPQSAVILLENPQEELNHNGGQIAFGPDGLLYIAMGDNTVTETAQDLTDLPGSILRIDVDVSATAVESTAYAIPLDNPYAGNSLGWREEVFAYGFRNPWRFSIDAVSGEIWVADVGEDTFEEINLIAPGRNYGWPLMEGPECFQPVTCDTAGSNLEQPFYSYTHGEGVAVIGGHRYWGSRLPELAGLYVFGDYVGGKVWALRYDGAAPPERFELATDTPFLLTFGIGPLPQRELYVASVDGYLYRLDRVVTDVTAVPARASRLLGAFPNPFNPSTTLRYELATPAGDVTIDIVAVDGTRVQRLHAGAMPAGTHEIRWSGETQHGMRAASGVYFSRLILDGVAVDSGRMVLVQ